MSWLPYSPAVAAYLERHAIDLDIAYRLGVRYDRDTVVYPYTAPDGHTYQRRRDLNDPKRRTKQPPGEPLTLWWPAGRPEGGSSVLLCEGEPDALAALTALEGREDAPTVCGLPGTTTPPPTIAAELGQVGTLYLALDGDEAGRDCADKIARALQHHVELRVVEFDEEQDLADRLASEAAGPAWLVHALEQAPVAPRVRTAPPTGDYPRRRRRRQADEAADRSVRAESLVDTRPEPARWLWADRIPLGTATLLVGREKVGKSTLSTELAGQLSRGLLEGDCSGEAADTLIVTYEDSAARTLVPRLMAAGADLSRVHLLTAQRGGAPDLVTLPADVERIGELAEERGARLIIVDPLSASLGSDVDGHRDQDIRRAIAPLVALAERHDLAVLAVAHLNEAQGGDALSRVLGSRGLTAAVRSVLTFGRAPDAEDGSPDRVLAHAASNLGPEAASLACRVEGRDVEGPDGETIPTSRLVIVGVSQTRADDLVATPTREKLSERDEAAEFLRGELADGPRPVTELRSTAEALDIRWTTLRRAKDRLGVVSTRELSRGGRVHLTLRTGSVAPSKEAFHTGLRRRAFPPDAAGSRR